MGLCAFLFPGQASQYSGMGRELHDNFPAARAVFEEADRALGFSISHAALVSEHNEAPPWTPEPIDRRWRARGWTDD